jgi:hypothetical protein
VRKDNKSLIYHGYTNERWCMLFAFRPRNKDNKYCDTPFGCELSLSNGQRDLPDSANTLMNLARCKALEAPGALPEPTAGSRLHARRSQSMAMANMRLMFAADRRVGCPFAKMGPPRCGHCQATGRRPARHVLPAEDRRVSLAHDQLAAMRNAGGAHSRRRPPFGWSRNALEPIYRKVRFKVVFNAALHHVGWQLPFIYNLLYI